MSTINDAQREHWNGAEAAHWVEAADRYDAQLQPFGEALLAAVDVQAGNIVLDIGCGNGVTSLIAARTAKTVTGVDISEPMLKVASSRARELGITNVDFVAADAQTYGFPPPAADVIMSRFGIMFFDDPAAAFTNFHRTLAPGGRLGFVCWRPLVENEWLLVPGAAAAAHVELPDAGGAADGPGMFSLSERDSIGKLLEGAGFSGVEIAPVDTTITLGGGGTIDETLEFLLQTGIARALFEGASADQRARASDAVRVAFEGYYEPGVGVRMGAAGWIATAVRRG